MKKFAKISLTIAGIMGLVGCLLCLISVIGGGGTIISYANDEYVREQLEGRGGSLTRRLLNMARHLDDGELPKDLDINGEDAGIEGLERHIDVGEVQGLSLHLGAGSFLLDEKAAGEGETIDLYIQGEGSCDYYVKNKTLYVEGFKGHHVLDTHFNKNVITLKFPMGMKFDEVEIEVGAGIMEAYHIDARDIETTVGAGALSLYQSKAQELSVDIGAGEFCAQDMTSQEADLSVGVGSCSYAGSIARSLEAECNMGNIDLLLKGRESDYNYELECSGGNITMDSFETAAFAMEKEIDNKAADTFELRCNLGNISVHFEEE